MFESQFQSAEVSDLLSQPRQVARMLAFEAALAEAQAELRLIPESSARVIVAVCADAALHAAIDLSDTRRAGNPAIPFVTQLTGHVRERDANAAGWVHFGSTSQDVIDTGTMLALRDVLSVILRDLRQLQSLLTTIANVHARSAMPARTLLQQAMATTFGYKAAAWLSGIDRIAARLQRVMSDELALQLGGPVGTLATGGEQSEELITAVAEKLGLARPEICWHTSRERVASVGSALAMLAGQLGKIARDVVLLMQTEVGEVSEQPAPGKGSSSDMPHKHNPVDSLVPIAVANLAPQLAASLLASMVQEHERAAGSWHAEWLALPQLCNAVHSSLQSTLVLIETMQIDSSRMTANLEATLGLLHAGALVNQLSVTLGREPANELVGQWCASAAAEQRQLREIATRELEKAGALTAIQLDTVFGNDREIDAAEARVRYFLRARSQVT